MNFKHKWIYYPWIKGFSPSELVPDDSSIAYSIGTCYCEDFDEPYMMLKTLASSVRAKPWEQMIVLPDPNFVFRERVKEKEGNERIGTISNLIWHFKDENFRYSIMVEGKERKRIYKSEELEAIG
jgi:hypothetical protein